MRPSVSLLTLGLILFLVHSSSGLKCYLCIATKEDCDKAKSINCKAQYVGCTKTEYDNGIILKSCASAVGKTSCEDKELNKKRKSKCYFCTGDNCNGSRRLRSSIWMWPVSTLLAVWYLSYF